MTLDLAEHVSLEPYNTLAVDASARFLAHIETPEQVKVATQLEAWQNYPHLVLGEGSNILLTGDFPGVVLINRIPGIEVVKQNSNHVWLRAGAGVNWHQFVCFSIENNWAGVENLSLIPGTVGAAPIQNIGAYGAEFSQVFDHLTAFDLEKNKVVTFGVEDCAFRYRDSIFKSTLKNKFVILNVTMKLCKTPNFNLDYGQLRHTVEGMGLEKLSLRAVSDAVIKIRNSKLPNPAELPNAGSFFKNPIIPVERFNQFAKKFPEMPHYPMGDKLVKIPAGWLIEQCQWKGKRIGDAGIHENHALVLVNFGSASGEDLLKIVRAVQRDVRETFEIDLIPEVNILPE